MGYENYLKNMLYPLKFYDFSEGIVKAELKSNGESFDEVFEALEEVERECFIEQSEGYALSMYEAILPYSLANASLENRRLAVKSLINIDGASFTLEAINSTISGCGIKAEASEGDEFYTVTIDFPDLRGKPDDYENICYKIEQILPCHLNVLYNIRYLSFTEQTEYFPTWQSIENDNMTWYGLEHYTA